MSGISLFPLRRKPAARLADLPDKFTDADVKAAYDRRGGTSVASIRDGWEEESKALQEEAIRSTPDARLDGLDERIRAMQAALDRTTGLVAGLRSRVTALEGRAGR
ncbi:MAG: hypothetical protein EOP01_04755 [Propionibacteriaceae bacterium]|nr:MAG: hypothetical protein EOP01_04755 [Propionibacteriaceae bacterium]